MYNAYGLVFLIAGLVCAVGSIYQRIKAHSFDKDTATCMATITDVEKGSIKITNREQTTYMVTLSYQVNDVSYTNNLTFFSAEYEDAIGKEIEIRYWVNKPNSLVITNKARILRNQKMMLVLSVLMLILASVYMLQK